MFCQPTRAKYQFFLDSIQWTNKSKYSCLEKNTKTFKPSFKLFLLLNV